MANIPGQSELRAFQQVFDGFLFIAAESVRVFNGNHQFIISDPFLTQRPENGKRLHIWIKIPVIHLHFPVREGDENPVMHMHVQGQRPAAGAETLSEAEELFGDLHGAPNSFQIGVGHQTVEVRNVQIFIQMNRIIDPGLFRRAQQQIRLFQAVSLIFREVHVQFDEPEAEVFTQSNIVFQRPVFNERRHSELHNLPPLFERDHTLLSFKKQKFIVRKKQLT